MNLAEMLEVVVLGGGPAGQTAALWLGRSSRKVVVIDANAGELETVTCVRISIDDVERNQSGFTVHCADGTQHLTRALLLAPEVVTPIPAIAGAERFRGSSLHQCPYCDGWEVRGRKIGVLGADETAVELALKLLHWSPRVTLFANGSMVDSAWAKRLEKGQIQVVPGTVGALDGKDRNLELLRLDGGPAHECEALFFPSPRKYHSSIVARLGCDVERMSGAVCWRPDGDHIVEGLFVAGHVLGTGESAASDGIKAAQAANDWLIGAHNSSLAVMPDLAGARVFRRTGVSRRRAI